MNQSSCAKCGAVVVDAERHEEWHQYHQQQLVRMVHQIDRQQKVTGGLIMRFSSFVNKGGGADGHAGITVDLLAFATYWIGAGMAIGVLAWSVSERRWIPAGAMLLFALGAMYLAYREIRPASRSEPMRASEREDVDVRAPSAEPTPTPGYSPAPPAHATASAQAQQYQYQQESARQRPSYPTAAQPASAPQQPQPQPQYGQAPQGTPNGRTPPVRRNDGWR